MAGSKTGDFVEIVSPFLRRKLSDLIRLYGWDSREAQVIARQYITSPLESAVQSDERRRHYESELKIVFDGEPVVGVERLYRRTILIEPTTVCAAHCRWCLRGQYPVQTLSKDQITHATRYIGSKELRDDINEILITGGDPLMSLPLLGYTLGELTRNAPNVRVVRIGSRVLFQDPERVNDAMLEMFGRYPHFRFEIGVNVNHPLEFWDESVAAIQRLQGIGVRFYNQHPLLRGVNDDLSTLQALYEKLRQNDIEAHYLFHSIPLRGMNHHRTSLARGAELAAKLTSCGVMSGRVKPRYAVLSDIGKIVIYDGVVADYRDDTHEVLLRSGYRLEERQKWNPAWQVPPSVVLDNEGYMQTWYLDAREEEIGPDGAPDMISHDLMKMI